MTGMSSGAGAEGEQKLLAFCWAARKPDPRGPLLSVKYTYICTNHIKQNNNSYGRKKQPSGEVEFRPFLPSRWLNHLRSFRYKEV